MVSLYTAQRKIRSDDPYAPESCKVKRPYLPTIVYTNRIREAFPGVPVILGGVEASLRRVSHYDYYQDRVRRSVLLDSKADMLVYGNAEGALEEITRRLSEGVPLGEIRDVRGTAVRVNASESREKYSGCLELPPHEEVSRDHGKFSLMTKTLYENMNPFTARRIFQGADRMGVLINPPSFPLSSEKLDKLYSAGFRRREHPLCGRVEALETVRGSVTSHRGCAGGCRFCSIFLHQGKTVQSRSRGSVLSEVETLSKMGISTVTDIGGPSANMYGLRCGDGEALRKCRRVSCLYPGICPVLDTSPGEYASLLEAAGRVPGVKHVFVSTGIRHDLALNQPGLIKRLCRGHIPGHLSTAPEHCRKEVLDLMGKPGIAAYERFIREFRKESEEAGREQYAMPYFIVGHPGADGESEKKLASYVRKNRIRMRQIQEFYPTPMTASTSMYYTGLDPFTGRKVSVCRKGSVKKKWKRGVLNG